MVFKCEINKFNRGVELKTKAVIRTEVKLKLESGGLVIIPFDHIWIYQDSVIFGYLGIFGPELEGSFYTDGVIHHDKGELYDYINMKEIKEGSL